MMWTKAQKAKQSMLEALRYLAKKRCNKRNCGTVCLCEPCHARKALEYYDKAEANKRSSVRVFLYSE